MAEKQAAEGKAKALSGWLKTLLGGLAGVLSGALVMYLSPLLDRAIKPTKPVANFAVEQQGLTVTLQNRSFGSGSGWWDFGDGSPLEPFVPGREVVTHTYPQPGDYTVKLTLRNAIGDENERAVTVRLEGVRGEPPRIEGLEAVPVSPGSYAPATFRLTSRVKNAQVCVWDLGDDRPLEIITEPSGAQERLVTFPKPGGYVVKLAAVNGSKAVQKSEVINVIDPPSGMVTAALKLTEQATHRETARGPYLFSEVFPPDVREGTFPISKQMPARPGYEIVDVLVTASGGREVSLGEKGELALDGGPTTRNLRLQVSADRKFVKLTGDLVRDRRKEPPKLLLTVTVVQQKRTPVTRTVPVMATLATPGSASVTLPPLPSGWVEPKRELRLEVRDGEQVLYREGDLPRGAVVTVRGRRCLLTALHAGDQVRVDLLDLPPGVAAR